MSTLTGARILLVDDTPANLRVLSQMLAQHGFQILVANSGARALESVQVTLPDLILLDIMMPEMTGYEVCQHLKANPLTRDIPIIFISALDSTDDKVHAFEAGGVDYVTKPFQFAEVQARVKTHLALRELQKRLEEKNTQLEQEIVERQRAQAAEQEALHREMNLARNIQMSMLPQTVPTIPGADIAGVCAPAREVGGDFYGYYRLEATRDSPGGYALAVGDVTGKGIPAALYMAMTTTMLIAQAPLISGVTHLLSQLNAALYPYMSPNQMNVGLCYAQLEPDDRGDYIAHLANAGMMAPILRRGGQCQYLEIGGLPLGLQSTALPYGVLDLPLQTGDIMVLSSDGIVEAKNAAQEMYSFERLLARTASAPSNDASAIQEWILADVRAFVGEVEPHDDMTLVILVIPG